MKKLIAGLLVFVSLFIGAKIGSVLAQEEPSSSGVSRSDIILPPQSEPGFLGQDHFYSVTFRGNGEAVVAFKVVLTNKSDKPLNQVSLRIPKVTPSEIFAYQVLREPACIRYLTNNSCAETQEPDYYGYYWSRSKYQRAQNEFSGDTLKIDLPQAISSDKSGSYLVYFRSFGYAKKDIFGAYKFTFETAQTADDIRNLTLGISTDSDLVLRGAKGEVQYRFQDATATLKTGVGGVAPAESGAMDTFYNQIGYGTLNKNATSLAPLESYKVSSSYAKNRLSLYAKELFIGLAILLGLIAAVFFAVRLFLKRGNQTDSQTSKIDVKTLAVSLGLSFGAALLVFGFSLLIIFLTSYLIRNVAYDLQAVVAIFVVVVSFAIYALFLFVPGLYLGTKKGIGWGIVTVFMTVFWLLILMGIGFLIYFALRSPSLYPTPMPLGGADLKQY